MISAVDVFLFLLVIVSVSFHGSFIVSHDLISFQFSFRDTSHHSRSSSSHDAITSSQNSSWLLFIFTVVHQNIFTSYWFTVILGAFFVIFNLISAFFIFPASSVTLIDNVHSSLIVAHDDMDFQFKDNSTLQFFVLLSLRDATKTSQI